MKIWEKGWKRKESFGLALSLPNTGSLLQATSGKAEKPIHGCTPVWDADTLQKNTKERPICQIKMTYASSLSKQTS